MAKLEGMPSTKIERIVGEKLDGRAEAIINSYRRAGWAFHSAIVVPANVLEVGVAFGTGELWLIFLAGEP